jgi:lipid-binding SYLF domain-containing protein
MKRCAWSFVAGLLVVTFAVDSLHAQCQSDCSLTGSCILSEPSKSNPMYSPVCLPLPGIPDTVLSDAVGVAIIPAHSLPFSRTRRGVVFAPANDGNLGNPVFITATASSLDGKGLPAHDVVLVFRTRGSLDFILSGRKTVVLGDEVTVEPGLSGGMFSTRPRKPDVYAYADQRRQFVGASLDGVELRVDANANRVLYGVSEGDGAQVLDLERQFSKGLTPAMALVLVDFADMAIDDVVCSVHLRLRQKKPNWEVARGLLIDDETEEAFPDPLHLHKALLAPPPAKSLNTRLEAIMDNSGFPTAPAPPVGDNSQIFNFYIGFSR